MLLEKHAQGNMAVNGTPHGYWAETSQYGCGLWVGQAKRLKEQWTNFLSKLVW